MVLLDSPVLFYSQLFEMENLWSKYVTEDKDNWHCVLELEGLRTSASVSCSASAEHCTCALDYFWEISEGTDLGTAM